MRQIHFLSLSIVGSNKGPKYIKTDPKLLQLFIFSQNLTKPQINS